MADEKYIQNKNTLLGAFFETAHRFRDETYNQKCYVINVFGKIRQKLLDLQQKLSNTVFLDKISKVISMITVLEESFSRENFVGFTYYLSFLKNLRFDVCHPMLNYLENLVKVSNVDELYIYDMDYILQEYGEQIAERSFELLFAYKNINRNIPNKLEINVETNVLLALRDLMKQVDEKDTSLELSKNFLGGKNKNLIGNILKNVGSVYHHIPKDKYFKVLPIIADISNMLSKKGAEHYLSKFYPDVDWSVSSPFQNRILYSLIYSWERAAIINPITLGGMQNLLLDLKINDEEQNNKKCKLLKNLKKLMKNLFDQPPEIKENVLKTISVELNEKNSLIQKNYCYRNFVDLLKNLENIIMIANNILQEYTYKNNKSFYI